MSRKGNLVVAAIFVIIGLAFAIYASRYSLGFAEEPGPGLIPMVAGLLVAALSVGLFVMTALSPRSAAVAGSMDLEVVDASERWPARPFIVAALLAVYIAALNWLGFFISTGMFLFATIKLSGAEGYWKPLVASVSVTISAYVLFVVILGLKVPGAA